jgi:hypothetical protein
MKKYRLTGIEYPGTVNLPKLGKVNLEDLPEEKLDELYQNGIPFLELSPEARADANPNEPVIGTAATPIQTGNQNKGNRNNKKK